MILFANNASTSLASACTESSTYIDILPGMAVLFPVPSTAEDYFLITLVNPNDGGVEIMRVTSVYGDRFNVLRAQEGTPAMAFPQNTIVENRLTAGSLEQLLNDIAATTTQAGRLRLATLAEALAGVVQDAAVSPYTLNAVVQANIQPVLDEVRNQLNTLVTTVAYIGYPGELRFFFEQNPPTGWVEANGQLIQNASERAPLLFQELQRPENTWKLTSETNWQAMSNAVFATDGAGRSYRWNNVGGVARFVLDTTANTIRVPDLRGMYMESAGFDNLIVGGVHGDGIRDITGAVWQQTVGDGTGWRPWGAFSALGNITAHTSSWLGTGHSPNGITTFQASRDTPTLNAVKPRAVGMLLCVCLGIRDA